MPEKANNCIFLCFTYVNAEHLMRHANLYDDKLLRRENFWALKKVWHSFTQTLNNEVSFVN